MKALFISNDPGLFNPTSAVRTRMLAYANAIGELHIISPAKMPSEERLGNLSLYGVRSSRFARMHTMAARAHTLIIEKGIEVVSAQDPFEIGMAALKAIHGTSAKLHIQVHTDFLSPWFVRGGVFRSPQVRMPLLNRIRRRLADRVLPQADGIRAVSRRVADSLVVHYGDRIPSPVVIPIAVPVPVTEKVELPPHDFSFVLMTIGRLEPEKRIQDIIVALARITHRYPSIGLMVIGDGRERKRLERLVHNLGLASKVLFLGWRTDLPGLLRNANTYIQASAYEGYGMTLIEAALAHVPIITTDVGIVGEVFKGYEEVLAAPPGDPAALAVHIVGLIEDTRVRAELPMRAEAAARAHLAAFPDQPEAIARDLAQVLSRP